MTCHSSFPLPHAVRVRYARTFIVSIAVLLVLTSAAIAQSWTGLTNQPSFPAGTALLLTDGTVMVQQMTTSHLGTGQWWRLTPDSSGSYVNGTWSQLASMPAGYAPRYYASAVLPDGRVVVEGGENNGSNVNAHTNLGAIFDPAANAWTSINPPSGESLIGDASSVVLPNGTFMLGACCSFNSYLLNASNLTWTFTGSGKADSNNEEGWVLLPNGKVLTVDNTNAPHFELYDPATGNWSTQPGTTGVTLVSGSEVGPAVLRPDGTVFATGATSNTAIYNPNANTWSGGRTMPNGDVVFDGPAALLPSGNVLVDSSPANNPPSQFVEFDGSNLNIVPAPPNAGSDPSFVGRMLVLPSGQVLFTDESTQVEVYTPSGTFLSAWQPTITSVSTTLHTGTTNHSISGTQFNGLSQGAMYGDDSQAATNYPLVRITNNSTGHVFYAKTHGHSTMAVATGSTTVSTLFDIPGNVEAGASTLQVVANGIPSNGVAVTIVAPTPGTGTVTITGFQQYMYTSDGSIPDTGYIAICVNGGCDTLGYPNGDFPGFLAQYLRNQINAQDPYVTASWNGDMYNAVLTLTARTAGSNTNYSLSAFSVTNDPTDFPNGSFTLTASGPTLTGGQD